jgi:nucleoside-diphosphate-sugar epimerase
MRVFVTGASGWIGQAVLKELIGNGHTVLGLVRSDTNAEIITALGADVLKGSIEDLETLKIAVSKCDGVIHLAFGKDFANFQALCEADNAAIEAMGEALEGTNRPFIVTSGTLILAQPKPEAEAVMAPFLGLVQARGRTETNALNFVSKGVRVIVLRLAPTNHGEGDRGFMSMLVEAATKNNLSAYVDSGSNVWPASHRLDTAIAYRLALEKAKSGAVYEVVSEDNIPTKAIAEAIGAKLNIPVVSKPVNEAMAHFGFIGLPLMAHNPVSGDLIKKELGWNPTHPSLFEDIKETTFSPPWEGLGDSSLKKD